ncbi:MAG: hypothetical protein HKO06_04620 [Pseudomonadales bacterium]|nr:hypothetical protein [Pseudomonadales bacterium]
MNQRATELSAGQVRLNRIKLLVLWLVPFGLMAIAGVCYYLVQTGQLQLNSKNNGVLIQPPIQLQQLGELSELDKQVGAAPHELSSDSPWANKWSLVIPAFEQCSERCRDALYQTRQLHIRLDKNANRVQRVLLATPASAAVVSSEDFLAFVNSDHLLLRRLLVNDGNIPELRNAITASDGETARFFIVDPEGWAMMVYYDAHEGNAILADLKHLLKYSRQR